MDICRNALKNEKKLAKLHKGLFPQAEKQDALEEQLEKTYPYPADLRSEREILAAWEEKQK